MDRSNFISKRKVRSLSFVLTVVFLRAHVFVSTLITLQTERILELNHEFYMNSLMNYNLKYPAFKTSKTSLFKELNGPLDSIMWDKIDPLELNAAFNGILTSKVLVLRNETIIRSLLVKESKSLLDTMNITYAKKK